jgi:hypothetical protein
MSMIQTCEPRPKMADIGALVSERGSMSKVSREIGVNRNTLYRWVQENNLPKDRAVSIGLLWDVPWWVLHDPWAGTPYAYGIGWKRPEPEEVGAPAKVDPKEKPKPPPMLTEEGQPTPGWKYTYRPPKVDQYNPLIVVKVRPGARWIEDFPEGKVGFPERLTWLDGREIRMVDNGTGTPVYVEADTGMHFGGSKVHLKVAHAAFRAMAERGIHERVEAKWEGVDGEE